MLFRDRIDAGRRLAFALMRYRSETPLILGIPRGGVPVAYEVARALKAPLDIWVARKLGVPGFEELGMGAVAEGGEMYFNENMKSSLDLTDAAMTDVVRRKTAELEHRTNLFRRGRPAPEIQGRTVILIDDGIATGATVRAVVEALRKRHPKRLILATPVASAHTLTELRHRVDEVVCLDEDPYLFAIGAYYENFRQTTDKEVAALLERARERYVPPQNTPPRGADPAPSELAVDIEAGLVQLEGTLTLTDKPTGLVLFAHGSGSNRHSPRNRLVANELQRAGFATLLFDLLTDEEAIEDIDFLATRLLDATTWATEQPETKSLHIGYFGASTGAAAALIAAARRPELISAVVSRGGRPDLAKPYLQTVVAPTLLIVGSADRDVLALNQEALELLRGPCNLVTIPHATHLFAEPGALHEVARLASTWFSIHLGPQVFEASA